MYSSDQHSAVHLNTVLTTDVISEDLTHKRVCSVPSQEQRVGSGIREPFAIKTRRF